MRPVAQGTLRYPARGVATLWETGDPVAVHSLYNVLASGRSRISVVRL